MFLSYYFWYTMNNMPISRTNYYKRRKSVRKNGNQLINNSTKFNTMSFQPISVITIKMVGGKPNGKPEGKPNGKPEGHITGASHSLECKCVGGRTKYSR